MKLNKILSITDFSPEDIDISELEEIVNWLPINAAINLYIAQEGMVKTLHAANKCQEIISKLDRLIGSKEIEKNKAWAEAALIKSKNDTIKTAKDKEWFANSDENYIKVANDYVLAKAAKKYFESKADNFINWHFAFKIFLKRDMDLEDITPSSDSGYVVPSRTETRNDQPRPGQVVEIDFGG